MSGIDRYELGYYNGANRMAYVNGVLAFGAIRRAVSVARLYDNPDELFGPCADDAAKLDFDMTARTVRCAIRAAIGSDKA